MLALLRDPTAHAVVCRKVALTLRGSVWEQIRWAARALGVDSLFRFTVSPLAAEYLPTGQKIVFLGADDPAKSKSIRPPFGSFSVLWFEELTEFNGMDDIRTMKASILRGGPSAMTICTYNPPMSARNWVNAEALVPTPGRLTHSGTYLDLPPDWLGEAFLADAETLRRVNERAYRHMYLGEITGTGGQVFGNLELRALTPEELAAGQSRCGLDFGFAVDPDMFVRAAYDPRLSKITLLDEFRGVRVPAERLAEEVLRRGGGSVVRCDSAEPRMIDRLRSLGVQAIGVKKGPGSVAAGIRWLQERGSIVIDPKRCPHTAKEFSAYEYTPAPDGTFLSEFPDRDNHSIDALRYAMEPVISERGAKTAARMF